MIGRSLRWRLLLAAAAAILVALVVAWALMTLLFERHLQRQQRADMTRDALALVAALQPGAGAPTLEDVTIDPRLQVPAGGYYWQVDNAAGQARSRSLWDQQLPAPADASGGDWRQASAPGPFGADVALLYRRIRDDASGGDVVVQLAQDVAPLQAARRGFARELALFLGLLWAVLSAAAWLQVTLGLRPLDRVRASLDDLRGSARRRLPDAGMQEIRPLTAAINALADAREHDLERARHRAADLAHGLKTPLAALAAQSRRARAAGAGDAADGMDRAIAAIAATVDAELARARLASGDGGDADTPLRAAVERIVNVLEHTERGGELAFAIAIDDALALPMPAELVAEMLGPVLENAVRYARRQVRVAAFADADGLQLHVDDDGPGIAGERADDALVRGRRLDESGGSGLGLAIARDLAEAAGARLALQTAELGGLRVAFHFVAAS